MDAITNHAAITRTIAANASAIILNPADDTIRRHLMQHAAILSGVCPLTDAQMRRYIAAAVAERIGNIADLKNAAAAASMDADIAKAVLHALAYMKVAAEKRAAADAAGSEISADDNTAAAAASDDADEIELDDATATAAAQIEKVAGRRAASIYLDTQKKAAAVVSELTLAAQNAAKAGKRGKAIAAAVKEYAAESGIENEPIRVLNAAGEKASNADSIAAEDEESAMAAQNAASIVAGAAGCGDNIVGYIRWRTANDYRLDAAEKLENERYIEMTAAREFATGILSASSSSEMERQNAYNAMDAAERRYDDAVSARKSAKREADEAAESAAAIGFFLSVPVAADVRRPGIITKSAYAIVESAIAKMPAWVSASIAEFHTAFNIVTHPELITAAARGIVRRTAVNTIRREGTPTQWRIYYRTAAADWEDHDVADMVSAAAVILSTAAAADTDVMREMHDAEMMAAYAKNAAKLADADAVARAALFNMAARDSGKSAANVRNISMWDDAIASAAADAAAAAEEYRFRNDVVDAARKYLAAAAAESKAVSADAAAKVIADAAVADAMHELVSARNAANAAAKIMHNMDAELSYRIREYRRHVVDHDAAAVTTADEFVGPRLYADASDIHAAAAELTDANAAEHAAAVAMHAAEKRLAIAEADVKNAAAVKTANADGKDRNFCIEELQEYFSRRRDIAAAASKRCKSAAEKYAAAVKTAKELAAYIDLYNRKARMRNAAALHAARMKIQMLAGKPANVFTIREYDAAVSSAKCLVETIRRDNAAAAQRAAMFDKALADIAAAHAEMMTAYADAAVTANKLYADTLNTATDAASIKRRRNGRNGAATRKLNAATKRRDEAAAEYTSARKAYAEAHAAAVAANAAYNSKNAAYMARMYGRGGAGNDADVRLVENERVVKARSETAKRAAAASMAFRNAVAAGDNTAAARAAIDVVMAGYSAVNNYLADMRAIRTSAAPAPISLEKIADTMVDVRRAFGADTMDMESARRRRIVRAATRNLADGITDRQWCVIKALYNAAGEVRAAARKLDKEQKTVRCRRAEVAAKYAAEIIRIAPKSKLAKFAADMMLDAAKKNAAADAADMERAARAIAAAAKASKRQAEKKNAAKTNAAAAMAFVAANDADKAVARRKVAEAAAAMPPKMFAAYNLVASGLSVRAAADKLGKNEKTIRESVNAAKSRIIAAITAVIPAASFNEKATVGDIIAAIA